jgi:4'-phosphopantetheinyl transferase
MMPETNSAPVPRVQEGEVHVCWFATDLSTAELEDLAQLLDPTERARADRFHFLRDKGRFIAGRGRLRALLGRYTGSAPDRLEFDAGPFGKPALRPGAGRPSLPFNLSHSEGIGVLAIGALDDLGVDVERVRPLAETLAIAEQVFAAEEQRALRAIPEVERSVAFFRYWTRKEAVLKSLGRGLSHSPASIRLPPNDPAPARVELDCDGFATVRWIQSLPALCDGFVAALATAGPTTSVRSWNWPGE